MTIIRYIPTVILGTLLALLVLPVTVTAQSIDTDTMQADRNERIRQMQERVERARSATSEAHSSVSGSSNSSVSNEVRVESNGGASRVRVQTTINGETVEDIDETVENGRIERTTSVEQDGARVETRVRASATSGSVENSAASQGVSADGTTATSALERIDERATEARQRQERVREQAAERQQEASDRIEERRMEIQERQAAIEERIDERLQEVRSQQRERIEQRMRIMMNEWVNATVFGLPLPIGSLRSYSEESAARELRTQTIVVSGGSGTPPLTPTTTRTAQASSLTVPERFTNFIQTYVLNLR